MSIRIKRAYEAVAPTDGYRVLVDRIWPRGKSKESLAIDTWMREVAPSDGLRKWFGHVPSRYPEFRTRYLAELGQPPAHPLLEELAHRAAHETVTLVYGAKDEEHNQAVVLSEEIQRRVQQAGSHAHHP